MMLPPQAAHLLGRLIDLCNQVGNARFDPRGQSRDDVRPCVIEPFIAVPQPYYYCAVKLSSLPPTFSLTVAKLMAVLLCTGVSGPTGSNPDGGGKKVAK